MSALSTGDAPTLIQQNPFPGLRPFEESEAELFFGREPEITALLGRVMRQHFLAVLGSSGCGKSSLIKAGLIPSLKYEQMDDGDPAWRIAVMRPGNDPFKQLAIALTQEEALGNYRNQTEADVPIMQMILRRGQLGIVEAAREAALPSEAKLLVLVDQFEELFRFPERAEKAHALDEARAFVNLLLAAANQRDWPIYVVLTMRSEFLGQCAVFRGLAEAITDGLYLLPDMSRAQLREVIQQPIAKHNGRIKERLVNRLLNDLGGNADQLPILQHALMRLWAHWTPLNAEGSMDLPHYEFIGELKGSLSAHAENIYQEELQTKHEKQLAEMLFRSITETTAEGQTVRKPTKLGVICRRCLASTAEMQVVIEQFRAEGRSFLMPPQDVELDEETAIDISHESLIRQWQRLSAWAEVEAKEAKLYADLKRDAVSWQEKGRKPDWLYVGARLTEARDWASAHPILLDDKLAKEFLTNSLEMQKYAGLLSRCEKWISEGRDESLLLRGKELTEAEQWLIQAEKSDPLRPILLRKEVKELVAASRRARRRIRDFKIGLATAFVLVLAFASYAYIQQVEAQMHADFAEAQRRLAESEKAIAEEERKESEKQAKLAAERLYKINDLEYQVDSGDLESKKQQISDAGVEIEQMRKLLSDRQAIRIRYFFKSTDKTNVEATLQSIGYKVTSQTRVGSAPTNAIWWGEGIKLEDVQFIAYTLIQNGLKIRYIGRIGRAGEIQIGGRPQSLGNPSWSVEKVRALTRLPVNNNRTQ
jgi:hypothetical protein